MDKVTKVFLLVFLLAFPLAFAGDFAYNRICGAVSIVDPIESNGAIPVNIQDQHTPLVLVYMNEVLGNNSLAANFTKDEYNITVNSAVGVSVGNYVGVFDSINARYYAGNVLAINGNVLSMDTPSDFTFATGSRVQWGNKEMNVDGSGTPRIFSLRADPALPFSVDVTRVIIHITDNTAMDDAKFGGITALTRGVVLRKTNDDTAQNIFNVKSNGEFGELAFDKAYDDKAPAGFYGFSSRLTFGGQSKMGVTIRLDPDGDLQLIVQDDLTGLETFRIMVEGHIVTD